MGGVLAGGVKGVESVTLNILASDVAEGGSAGPGTTQFESEWQTVASRLRRDLGAQIYGQWIRSIQLGDFCGLTGTLELLTPSDFSASWVSDHYADRIRLAWTNVNPVVRQLKIRTKPGVARVEMLQGNGVAERPAVAHIVEAFPVRSSLDPRLTFANFVRGQTNVLAVTAAERVAAAERPLFNPLYLQAATGQGKTHLMHAIGHAYSQINPDAQILYMSAEKFM
ncbi:MAG: hypothetical protein RL481_707, partial [Pseudomonadota bacterium]